MTDTVHNASAAEPSDTESRDSAEIATSSAAEADEQPKEIGGRKGPDPTRFGDWEKNGRCIDF